MVIPLAQNNLIDKSTQTVAVTETDSKKERNPSISDWEQVPADLKKEFQLCQFCRNCRKFWQTFTYQADVTSTPNLRAEPTKFSVPRPSLRGAGQQHLS